MIRVATILLVLLTTTAHVYADRAPITPELHAEIHSASVQYFEKFRNYECTYSESTQTESNTYTQQTSQRIVEDALGQIRLESTIRQLNSQGDIAATIDSIRVYDLRNETRAHSQPDSVPADQRIVTITPSITVTDLIRPKTYVMAAGKPMHELLDSLRDRDIEVYAEELQVESAPDRLVEISFAESLESGDILRHTYTLDREHNYLPLRQVVYFNKKRYRVLEPTLQEVAPGVHFPVKAVRISYNKDSDENEMRSITSMSVESIRINTDIPPDTFKIPLRPNDTVTDLRDSPSAPDLRSSNPIPLG